MNHVSFEGNIEKALIENEEIITSISGISMYPMLRNKRDIIVVKRVDRPLVKGDVPVYRMPKGKIIMHRILKVREDDYVIRGDNTFILEYIPKSYVIGVLKAFYRDGKKYDCDTSRGYKFYVFINRISYPIRKVWAIILKFLRKIKVAVFGKTKK